MSESVGVCDNQFATARKLLILKPERCWSGRSGTLGKQIRKASPSDTETSHFTINSRLPLTTWSLV